VTTDPLDVRCLPYMPLEIERLRKSKAWLRCKRRPELAFYLVNLWMRAWHEVPAGSIENDDDVLADAAMCSPEQWEQVKEDVLVGWNSKGDRLFHSTVTDIATVAANKLRKNKNRTEAAREALEKKRRADADSSVTSTVTDIATVAATDEISVTETVTDDEGKGREEKGKRKKGGADAPATLAFAGRIIRVTVADLEKWRLAYPNVSDFTAELTKADDYYTEHPTKDGKWFFQVSKWLDRANKDAGKARSPSEAEIYPPEIYESLR
jgi:uncharacterized protein YdaU (DUF1376 family)